MWQVPAQSHRLMDNKKMIHFSVDDSQYVSLRWSDDRVLVRGTWYAVPNLQTNSSLKLRQNTATLRGCVTHFTSDCAIRYDECLISVLMFDYLKRFLSYSSSLDCTKSFIDVSTPFLCFYVLLCMYCYVCIAMYVLLCMYCYVCIAMYVLLCMYCCMSIYIFVFIFLYFIYGILSWVLSLLGKVYCSRVVAFQ